MADFQRLLQSYDYKYPKSLIAKIPARPRDSARIFVYDRKLKKIELATFKDLPKFLSAGDVIVFNQTKVIPARFKVKKQTGGEVELLLVERFSKHISVLSSKKLNLGTKVSINKNLSFKVLDKQGSKYILEPEFSIKQMDSVLDKYGLVPLPPYLKDSPLNEAGRKKEYQTVFSKKPGAVAAPTASLHFTKSLLASLKRKGVETAFVTLHVGLGTFAPLTEQAIKEEKLHHEYFEIDKDTARFLNKAKKEGRRIIAVGTTVVRTLESASDEFSKLKKLQGETNLFLTEKSKLKFVDSLITNFHVPQSSLMMLVASFIGRKNLLELYKLAVKKNFRLFSFGDGMFIK